MNRASIFLSALPDNTRTEIPSESAIKLLKTVFEEKVEPAQSESHLQRLIERLTELEGRQLSWADIETKAEIDFLKKKIDATLHPEK